MLKYEPNAYVAFELSPLTRGELLAAYPPKFEKVVCHHVTVIFRPTQTEFDEAMKQFADGVTSAQAYGYSCDDSLECFSVKLNGTPKRPFHGFYHVTHSHEANRKPVDSNKLLVARNGSPITKIEPIILKGELKSFKWS